MTDTDYSACGLRLIVRNDPKAGTSQVAVYCDRLYGHDGNHGACIEWDGSTSRRVAQGHCLPSTAYCG